MYFEKSSLKKKKNCKSIIFYFFIPAFKQPELEGMWTSYISVKIEQQNLFDGYNVYVL